CASGKNVAKVNARKPENTRLLLISPAPESTDSTLKTQQKKSPLSLQSFVANISRHGKHWMTNWPTLSGLVMWMPETLTAA
ncbi:putative exonuclease VIII, ds DNA exonuclease encoded by prophage, partial [Escherichia coli PA49]